MTLVRTILSGAAAAVLAIPAIGTSPVLAAGDSAPGSVQVRGDGSSATSCTIPPPPPRSHKRGVSNVDGIKHQKYSNKTESPLSVSLYYLNVLPKHGYRVVGYGMGGGTGAGSGFNVSASCKLGGTRKTKYIAVAGGADKGDPTRIRACSGKTNAAWAACLSQSPIPPQALPFIPS